MTMLGSVALPEPAHIWVVEDDDALRLLLSDVLVEEGYQVSCFDCPRSALASTEAGVPNLLLLDLIFGARPMGLDAFEAIARDSALAHVPILLCTGAVARVRTLTDDQLARVASVVLKPFDLYDLLGAVAGALERAPRHGVAPRLGQDRRGDAA